MKRDGDPNRSKGTAKLTALRLRSGYSQPGLEKATGIGLRTLQRWEKGELERPPLWYLTNCAVVLDCSIEELIEDDWLQFEEFEDLPDYNFSWVDPDARGKTARLRKAR